MASVITKGAIVDLSATIAGVNGSLTGVNAYDVKMMLQHLEWVAVDLEAQYGIFTGFKKSPSAIPHAQDDSGLRDSDIYAIATILAFRSHAILGIANVTFERLRRFSSDYISRLSPVNPINNAGNEQLPLGAGNTRYGFMQPAFFDRNESISVESDGDLDVGDLTVNTNT